MHTEKSSRVTVSDVVTAVDDPDADADTVRDALRPVTNDGMVTQAAIETTVSDVSKLLATAETRIELAGDAYDDIARVAEPVEDIPTVRARLNRFSERLSAIESRIPELRPGISIPKDVESQPVEVYKFAVHIREIVVIAQEAIEAAEDFSFDAEQFESWLNRPDRRYDEFVEDLEVVVDAADELATTVDALVDESMTMTVDPAVQWADATMRTQVLLLLLTDLHAELADLRTLADRTGAHIRTGLADRINRAEEQVTDLNSALDTHATPTWRDRFGDDVEAFDATLKGFDPPVDWGAIDQALMEHQPNCPDKE
jgi:hypothetical protein